MSDAPLDALQLRHAEAIQQIVHGRSSLDQRVLRWSDWCNPILVKETRQALKSRQFSYTFVLLLIAVVGWTMIGISLMVPGIYFIAGGPILLYGYFLILLLPVGVVVPNAAFRSMAAELEDGTFEVLSISSLTERQIVLGKLSVAMLQTMVYFSALTPCIALTYLLRGVSLPLLAYVLVGTFALSLALSTLAVLFATLGRNRALQVVFTLLLFIALIAANVAWASGVMAAMSAQAYPSDFPQWLGFTTFLAFAASYILLGVLAAAAKIGLATENYSTRLRYVIWLQHVAAILLFVTMASMFDGTPSEVWVALLTILAIHWAFFGALMIGESGVVSPRARRRLPFSLFSRVFLTWFNPGGGPGYLLTLASFASALVFVTLADAIDWRLNTRGNDPYLFYGWVLLCYLAFYLGIARLLAMSFGNRLPSRMLAVVVIVVVLLLFGALCPLFLSFWMNNFREPTYEFYMFTNVFWTGIEVLDGKRALGAAPVLLSISAAVIATLNLLTITRDVTLVRIETPTRVKKILNQQLPPAEITPVDPFADRFGTIGSPD